MYQTGGRLGSEWNRREKSHCREKYHMLEDTMSQLSGTLYSWALWPPLTDKESKIQWMARRGASDPRPICFSSCGLFRCLWAGLWLSHVYNVNDVRPLSQPTLHCPMTITRNSNSPVPMCVSHSGLCAACIHFGTSSETRVLGVIKAQIAECVNARLPVWMQTLCLK